MRFILPDDFFFTVRASDGERRWIRITMAGYLVIVLSFIANLLWLDAAVWALVALNLALVPLTLVGVTGVTAARRRERRRMVASTMLLCCRCRHPVIEEIDPEHVICPECGRRETAERVRERWQEAYGVNVDHWQASTRR